MPELSDNRVFQAVHRYRGLLLPMAATTLILVILVPLPTFLMDVLLAGNITLSAVVLLTVMYVGSPLEFSVFPSLLLGLTLLRLVLNTATTRLILTNANQGTAAAGHVIETFGNFVAGGSLAVGIIIFVIIVVIQFVVITKGATRIAEVAARFTLDGMPGKQMAIDADLNAGLIDEAGAKKRREEITREADFYGAMDGASKFVRGDAIAGIVITLVNIIGGVYVGMVELDLGLMQCLSTFTRLTIGDGLVSQIPAFVISVAAGILITRTASRANLGEEMISQVFSHPTALFLTAGFLGLLVLTPLPKLPLLVLGTSCAAMAVVMSRSRRAAAAVASRAEAAAARKTEKVEDLLPVDVLALEVGYGLVKLVDRKQGGDLLERISMLRKQIAQDLGLIMPSVRIRDNMALQPSHYAILLKQVEIARGELMPGHLLAIDSGLVAEPVRGVETAEPAFGLPALWIEPAAKALAEQRNYTVVEPSAVLATHLAEIIKQHAAELLTRGETHRLVETLKQRNAKLVEEVVGELLKPGEVQKVLQNLLAERVPIRDLETVLESLGDWAVRTKDLDVLTEYARHALARTLCQQHRGDDGKVHCITLDPSLEDTINGCLERSDRGTFLTMPPAMQNRIVAAVRDQIEAARRADPAASPVILCSPHVRVWVRRLIEAAMPQVAVLAFNEIVKGVEVASSGMVVLNDEAQNVPSPVHA